MTKYQKEQYQIRYDIEHFICHESQTRATQMAHRLAQTKLNKKLYGQKYIDHNFNLVPVSSLEINDKYNIGNKLRTSQKLMKLIDERGNEMLSVKKINETIYE